MTKNEKLSDSELVSIVQGWISDSREFDHSDLRLMREWAIRFHDGEVDIPTAKGRSAVVSNDVADIVEWMLAGLLRVFTASDRIALYEPAKPEDEPMAKEATDGINYIFMHDCEGYRVLHTMIHNSLLHGNGPVKVWWEGAPEYKTETVRGLAEQEYYALISEPDVDEVLDVTEYLVGPNGEEIEAPGETEATEGKEDAAY